MPKMELRIREVDFKAGARPKGSNGVVAVGLPHRNYSVFKQAHVNQWEVKGSDPPNAVGKLNCFLFVGDVMKLKNVLKSPWTAFHGSFAFE